MAQTIERRATAVPTRGGRWPIIALAVMVVAALGAGTWWLVDEYTGIDRQIEVLIDDYNSAWVDGDGAGAVALMTPTGLHVNPTRPGGIGGDELAQYVADFDAAYDFDARILADPVIVESSPYYLAVVPAGGSPIDEGFSFFRIVEYQGELLISYHEWVD